MKKITLFVPKLIGGGAEKVALYLAQEFSQRGFLTDLLCIQSNKQVVDQLSDVENLKIYSLNVSRVSKAILPLSNYLKRNSPDVLLSFMTEANLVSSIACVLSKSKANLYWTEHCAYSKVASVMPRMHKYVYNFLIPVLAKKVSKIIPVSSVMADDFMAYHKIPKSLVNVIYNPVLNDEVQKKINLLIPDELLSYASQPYIISIGRLNQQKDFSTLLRAMSIVKESNPVKLLILGDGELRASLQEQINHLNLSDTVYLLGYQINPYPLLKKAEAFVMSSGWEGLPLVLVEALACNTPVISTDCLTGPSEILEKGKWGTLVPVGDSLAMANSILNDLNNRPFSNIDLIERANDFSVEKIADQYLNLMFGCKSL